LKHDGEEVGHFSAESCELGSQGKVVKSVALRGSPQKRMSKATKVLGPINAALIDISGTLHVGDDAIPGAIAACRKLFHRRNLKLLFLTNTSKMSSRTLLRRLREMGFDETAIPNEGKIITSAGATRRYLLRNELRPLCLIEDELLEVDFDGVDLRDPNCVLEGLAPSKFYYKRLNEAFRLLSRLKEKRAAKGSSGSDDENLLVAIHRATHYRDSDHELSLGPGGFVSLLEQTAGVSACVIGKPSREFYCTALSSLGMHDPSHAVMVGDDVVGDVKGALDAGFGRVVLVRTGKYVRADESGEKTGGVLPSWTVDSIVEAVDRICSTLE